jgi:hypothetical protein
VPVETAAEIDVRWLVNPTRAMPASSPAPSTRSTGHRRHASRERLSISGYWARGRTEDILQAEKREPIGGIA